VFPPTTQKTHHATPNLAAAVHQSAHPAVESEEASYPRSGAVHLPPPLSSKIGNIFGMYIALDKLAKIDPKDTVDKLK
jgi:hypothetical protein